MKTKRIYTLVLASLLLAGCQSSSVLSQNSQADLKMEAAYDSGSAYERSAEGAAADTEQAPSEEMTGSSEWTEPGDDSSMIVYTADITLQTRDYKKTWSEIKELILQYGGYIVSENLSNRSAGDASKPHDGQEEEGQVSSGFYSIKIPAEKLDSFIKAVAETGNIVSQSKNADNISKRYNDTNVIKLRFDSSN